MEALELRRDLRLPLLAAVGIITACQANQPLSGESAPALSPGTAGSDAASPAERPASALSAGRACETAAACAWWQDPDPRSQCCSGTCTYTGNDVKNCGGCDR